MQRLSLLGLLVAAVPALAQAPAKNSGADVVPSTAFAFVTARVSDLQTVEALKPVREAIAKIDKTDGSIEKFLGVPLDDVERITIFWPTMEARSPMAPFIVVTTRAPYNEAKVLKALDAVPPAVFFRRHFGHPGAGIDIAPPATKPETNPKGSVDPLTPPKNGSVPKQSNNDGAQVGDPPPKEPERVKGAGKIDAIDFGELYFREHSPFALFLLDDRTLLHIPEAHDSPLQLINLVGQLLRRKADGPLAEAIAAAGKHTIVAAARVQPFAAVIQREGDLPRELTPFRSLLKAQTVMLTADVDAKTVVNAKLTFADDAAARRAEPVLKTLIQHGVDLLADAKKDIAKNPEINAVMTPLIDLASASLEKAEVNLVGSSVTARAEAAIGPAVTKAMAAIPEMVEFLNTKQKTLNNLKQIGLAFHNFHDTMGHMPMDIVGADGKPLMSWRVAILPYIEQDNMFRQLDMTKAWDDPRNAKVLATMPNIYRVYGRDAEKGKTYLQMPSLDNKQAGTTPFQVPGRRTTFATILDGTSNTIMVVEAADALDWAKPGDIQFDKVKLTSVGDKDRKWFYAGFGDGSVRTIRKDKLTDDLLKALLSINGGEVVDVRD